MSRHQFSSLNFACLELPPRGGNFSQMMSGYDENRLEPVFECL